MSNFNPIIKWSGSKRHQSEEILNHFPKEIDTYYEPFCGGASVLFALLNNPNIKVNNYVCSDNNQDLINLWNYIKDEKESLKEEYNYLWCELNSYESQELKKYFYENIRNDFNANREPWKFFFLNRTCFNGLIRYNSKGEFNTSFHLNRNGIHPDKINTIIDEWSDLLNKSNVSFKCCSYQEIFPQENDFLYLDPPYAHTKGMYKETFDKDLFFSYLTNLKCKYALSYDGISGNDINTFPVPKHLFNTHILIKSGNSSFKRIKESDKNAIVYESLYIK
jgi:DNA adenine methylase